MRLSKIYTKTGDDGTTSADGKHRISKTSLQIAAIGDIDELNSWIGVADLPNETDQRAIQNDLFNLGGMVAMLHPEMILLDEDRVKWLEEQIDTMNTFLKPLENFILPNSFTHVARSVCRRAERSLIFFNNEYEGKTDVGVLIRYLNRLSDYLFVAARYNDYQWEITEELWDQKLKKRLNEEEE